MSNYNEVGSINMIIILTCILKPLMFIFDLFIYFLTQFDWVSEK